MLRGWICLGGPVLAAATAFSLGAPGSRAAPEGVLSWFRPAPVIDEVYQRGFRSDAMARLSRLREPLGVEAVAGDEEIQAFLVEWVVAHPAPGEMDLGEVFDALQGRFPGAQYLSANLMSSRSREDLLDRMTGWTAAANPDFTAVNTAVFASGRTLGAVAVMSRRLPRFCLEEANLGGGRYHNCCPHCEEIHALELDREARTLILSCPHCDLPFEVLAADSGGGMRRALDYFDGVSLPPPPGAGRFTPEQLVVHYWRAVAERCEYQTDQDRYGVSEVWKSSGETWEEASGDCEDTAILLADILAAAGIEARVAIGWNGNIGQHAWVAVRAGDRQYVVETTLQGEIAESRLLDAAEAAAYYQPEQLFDRDQLYFTRSSPERFAQDYFSPEVWMAVPARRAAEPGLTRR